MRFAFLVFDSMVGVLSLGFSAAAAAAASVGAAGAAPFCFFGGLLPYALALRRANAKMGKLIFFIKWCCNLTQNVGIRFF